MEVLEVYSIYTTLKVYTNKNMNHPHKNLEYPHDLQILNTFRNANI